MKVIITTIVALLVGCSVEESEVSNTSQVLQPSDTNFANYVDEYDYPHFIQDNSNALKARIKLLDQAPKGATVKVLTFVWENGDSTNLLAAHMCKAAKRGVKVQFMADSKYGSLVENDKHWFNEPNNEELYQWMANCGVEVRIYNKIPEIYNSTVYDRSFFRTRNGAKLKVVAMAKREYGTIVMSPLNRLNHRKLFLVEKTVKGKKVGCMILGGRNLGDHYLSWTTKGDQFLDSDVVLCKHHLSDIEERKYRTFESAKESFNDLWNAKKERINVNGGSTVAYRSIVHKIPARRDFRYSHIWFARAEENAKLSPDHPRSIDRYFKGDKEAPQSVRMIPLAKNLKNPNLPVPGTPMKHTMRWRLKTSGWDRDYKNDHVRQELYNGIDAELAEIYIESAYLTLDSTIKGKLERALSRGVKVTLVSNSAFTMDGAAAQLISLGNVEYIKEMKVRYPKLMKAYYLTAMAGHMLHFKGAAFRCQKMVRDFDYKNASSAKQVYQKRFILGSHNFHPRSGMSDKEHALVWNEKIGQTCLDKLEELKAQSNRDITVDPIYVAANPTSADRLDGVGIRLKAWYEPLIEDFHGNQTQIIVEFDEYMKNWATYNRRPDDDIFKRIKLRMKKYLFNDSGQMHRGAAGILGLLKPKYEDFL